MFQLKIFESTCIGISLSLNCRMFLIRQDTLSIRKRLLRCAIDKHNNKLTHLSKELSLSGNFLSTQLSTTDFYILTKYISSHYKKSLQKSSYSQHKKLSSLTRGCKLHIFTANETIANLTQYELSH